MSDDEERGGEASGERHGPSVRCPGPMRRLAREVGLWMRRTGACLWTASGRGEAAVARLAAVTGRSRTLVRAAPPGADFARPQTTTAL